MKRNRLHICILIIFLSVIILSAALLANPFWGFKEKVKEKSGIREDIVTDLLKTVEFLPKITYPLPDSTVSVPLTIKGTIHKEIDYIELKIDDGEWQKITQNPEWSITINYLDMGEHALYVHAIEGEIKGPDVLLNFNVSIIPTGISASDGAYIDKVRITWNTVTGAEKYYVYRSATSLGVYTEIGNTNATTYDDTIVSNNMVYYYKIKAYSVAAGYSELSAYDDGFLFPVPTGVSASDSEYDKIRITWNSVPNAEKYYIYRSLSSGSGYTETTNVTAVSYDDLTTGVGTNYYYKVRAWSTVMGFGPYSDYDVGVKLDIFAGVSKREMVSVPGGTYTQTDTAANSFSHTITGFKMGKYEVTYELWYAVRTWAVANGYYFANAGMEGHDGAAGAVPTGAKYEPVTTINWRDAMVWCNAYSELSGLTGIYYSDAGFTVLIKDSRDGSYGSSINTTAGSFDNPYVNWTANGYRLPTEGEWQYAASYKDGVSWTPYDYASGATADYNDAGATGLVAWYSANSSSKTHDVGTKTANALGIYDMSGNVWEWCWDWYGTWPGSSQTDYRGSGSGSVRMVRGGSWLSSAYYLRVGYHDYVSPYYGDDDIGFRLVRK